MGEMSVTTPDEWTLLGFSTDATEQDAESGEITVPVYGLGDYRFNLIHGTALFSLVTSTLVSTSVLVYLNYPCRKSLWSRPIGERLVVYLSVCDLLFSISHILDHSYMLAVRDHPPDVICATFGFFLTEFITAQALTIIFTAFNAWYMVVKQKKVHLGAGDWKLLAGALGLPAVFGVVLGITGHLGPTGPWCFIDMRRDLGPLFSNVIAVTMITTFALNLASYAAVYVKLRQVTRGSRVAKKVGDKTGDNKSSTKYHGTARIMMLFVAAYIGQWWAFVVHAIWGLVDGNPHMAITWATVFFSNMGGVFNFIAYTLVRRRYQSVQEAPTTSRATQPTSLAN